MVGLLQIKRKGFEGLHDLVFVVEKLAPGIPF
jgi:hypothetical protein